MGVLVIPRGCLNGLEESLELGVVMLYERNASQILDDRGKQSGNSR
jgi:hypothetical protein